MNTSELSVSNEPKKIFPYEFNDLIYNQKFIRTVLITNFHYGRDDTHYEDKFACNNFDELLIYLRKGEWSIYLDEYSDEEIKQAFEKGLDLQTKMGSGYGIKFEKIPLL